MLSPGDRVLMFETGHVSALRWDVAIRFGLAVDYVPGDWHSGVDPDRLERKLDEDREARKIKAVAVVHNETSTGVTSLALGVASSPTDLLGLRPCGQPRDDDRRVRPPQRVIESVQVVVQQIVELRLRHLQLLFHQLLRFNLLIGWPEIGARQAVGEIIDLSEQLGAPPCAVAASGQS